MAFSLQQAFALWERYELVAISYGGVALVSGAITGTTSDGIPTVTEMPQSGEIDPLNPEGTESTEGTGDIYYNGQPGPVPPDPYPEGSFIWFSDFGHPDTYMPFNCSITMVTPTGTMSEKKDTLIGRMSRLKYMRTKRLANNRLTILPFGTASIR